MSEPPSQRLPALLPPWLRQGVACGLVFLLSARLPAHLVALLQSLLRPGSSPLTADAATLLLAVDGFGLQCALYLSHQRLRGVRIWRCYPPTRLIPLSLHFLGVFWGVLALAPVAAIPPG